MPRYKVVADDGALVRQGAAKSSEAVLKLEPGTQIEVTQTEVIQPGDVLRLCYSQPGVPDGGWVSAAKETGTPVCELIPADDEALSPAPLPGPTPVPTRSSAMPPWVPPTPTPSQPADLADAAADPPTAAAVTTAATGLPATAPTAVTDTTQPVVPTASMRPMPAASPGSQSARSFMDSICKSPFMDSICKSPMVAHVQRRRQGFNASEAPNSPSPPLAAPDAELLQHAERYEPDEGQDHLVWAFFRLGQCWLPAERVAQPCEREHGSRDLTRWYADGSRASELPTGIAIHNPVADKGGQQTSGSPVVIVLDTDDNRTVFSLSDLDLPAPPAQYRYLLLDQDKERSKRFSLSCGGPNGDLLVVWKRDTPFYQKWSETIKVLAVPLDADHPGDAGPAGEFDHFVRVTRTNACDLLIAFAVALFPLLLQATLVYLIWRNSEDVKVDAVAEWIEAGDVEFTAPSYNSLTDLGSFGSAEAYKRGMRQYSVPIHDLFDAESGLCLTDLGFKNAWKNLGLGTLIIQLLLVRDAYQFWARAPMNLVTHPHLTSLRWGAFAILFAVMLANYGFVAMACFYGILGSAEDLPGMVGDCTMAFVVLELDDVVFKLAAHRIYKADLSARPGTSAYQTALDHCRHVQFSWRRCGQATQKQSCETALNRVGNAFVAASTPIVALCVLVLPWVPAICHGFIYEHGLLNNQHRCVSAATTTGH
jgi:hypothetical protein